jgi:glycine cleavage system H lipoate-binding protein
MERNGARVPRSRSIDSSPFEASWMLKVKATGGTDSGKLLSAEEYSGKTGH